VLDYAREIDKEIARKRMEFGYETELEELDERWKELFWDHYSHVWRLDWEAPQLGEEYREILERYRLLEGGDGE
jgi:beta-galactosidase GanA